VASCSGFDTQPQAIVVSPPVHNVEETNESSPDTSQLDCEVFVTSSAAAATLGKGRKSLRRGQVLL